MPQGESEIPHAAAETQCGQNKKKINLKKAATKYDSQQKSQILNGVLILFIMVLVASAVSHRDGSQ